MATSVRGAPRRMVWLGKHMSTVFLVTHTSSTDRRSNMAIIAVQADSRERANVVLDLRTEASVTLFSWFGSGPWPTPYGLSCVAGRQHPVIDHVCVGR
jgi:hypothetical protein